MTWPEALVYTVGTVAFVGYFAYLGWLCSQPSRPVQPDMYVGEVSAKDHCGDIYCSCRFTPGSSYSITTTTYPSKARQYPKPGGLLEKRQNSRAHRMGHQ